MAGEPRAGDLVGGKFALVSLLGLGRFGSIWEARDTVHGRTCTVKLYRKEHSDPTVHPYLQHVLKIYGDLAGQTVPGILMPIETGETDDYYYSVFEYVPNLRSLRDVISTSGPLAPTHAFRFLSSIAEVVARLHACGIVHADLKPANILVANGLAPTVRIIDFGMVRHVHADDTLLLVGTWAYMHPILSAGFGSAETTELTRIRLPEALAGPYLDIYAMGVLTVEMLTGTIFVPTPLTEAALQALLREKNPWFKASDRVLVVRASALLFQMLCVRPQTEGIKATVVSSFANPLADACAALVLIRSPEGVASPPGVERRSLTAEISTAVGQMELLREELAEATAAFIVTRRQTDAVPSPQQDEQVVAEVFAVFTNAIKRTRASWRISVAMTLIAFGLLVGMITTAVILAVVTGKSQWAVIFGGLGVSTIIGTLIWRPFDRVFRATILTQQIEMIHVQTVAAFRASTTFQERMRVCREAVDSLSVIFSTDANLGDRAGGRRSRPATPRHRRASGGTR